MPFDTLNSTFVNVVLDKNHPVLRKATKIVAYEILFAFVGILLFVAHLIRVLLGVSSRTDSLGIFYILLAYFVMQVLVDLCVLKRLRSRGIRKRLRIEASKIVEEYAFGLLGKEITHRQDSKNIKSVVMHYNQLTLTGQNNWNLVLGYDLFGSKEKMRSYADAVCEKAGIALQIVEGVA